MVKVEGNYGWNGKCRKCNEKEETTEHFIECYLGESLDEELKVKRNKMVEGKSWNVVRVWRNSWCWKKC